MDNDHYLITRFQAGEVEAFDRLMESHMDRVYRVAWQALHDHDEAMDATQEVFIRLHGALPRMGQVTSLSSWLYRVCLNHCIDRKRRMNPNRCELAEEDWEALRGSETLEPEWVTKQHELATTIRSAVDGLPRQQRSAFILRHYEHLSLDEIAQAIGCSTGAVKRHLSRATASLRGRLQEDCEVASRGRRLR